MWRAGLVAALAVSIAANVYLLVTRSRGAPLAAPAVAVAPADAAISVAGSAIAVPPSEPTRVPCPPPPPRADCSGVEGKLAETEQKLEAARPAALRYEHAPRSPAAELRARKLLDPMFAAITKSPHPYEVECHGDVCKLDVVDPSLERDVWMREVQSRGGFTSWSFGNGTFATLGTEAETARNQLMYRIGKAIEEASIDDCMKPSRPAGSLTVVIHLDSATRRLDARTDGSLANEPAGTCVRSHVQPVLDKIAVPDDVTTFPEMSVPVLP